MGVRVWAFPGLGVLGVYGGTFLPWGPNLFVPFVVTDRLFEVGGPDFKACYARRTWRDVKGSKGICPSTAREK